MRNVFQRALKKKGALKFMDNLNATLKELKAGTETKEFQKVIDHIEGYIRKKTAEKSQQPELRATKFMVMYDFVKPEERTNV